MDIVFLIYGLAFLGLGLTIVIRNDGDSRLVVSRILWLLAAFSFLHGFLEWTDLWRVVRGDMPWLAVMRPMLLLASYLFLFEFGRRLTLASVSGASRDRHSIGLLSPWAYAPLLLVILAGTLASDQPLLSMTAWSRYLAGFPGSCLAGIGCYLYARNRIGADEATSDFPGLYIGWYVAAGTFAAYGVLGGLIGPRTDAFPGTVINEESFRAAFHLPVQILRATCAVVVAISIGSLLRMFSLESRRRLTYALETKQHALTELLQTGERFKAILDSTNEGIVGLDSDGVTIFTNNAALDILGYQSRELIGRSFHAMCHHATADGAHHAAEHCPILDTMRPHAMHRVGEDIFWRKDGTPLAVTYKTAPLRHDDNIYGVVVAFQETAANPAHRGAGG